jgi:hypothetical protein
VKGSSHQTETNSNGGKNAALITRQMKIIIMPGGVSRQYKRTCQQDKKDFIPLPGSSLSRMKYCNVAMHEN